MSPAWRAGLGYLYATHSSRTVKPMNNDQLAALLQREFESLRAEMVTRDELRASEASTLRAIEGLGVQSSDFGVRWSGDFRQLSDQVQDLQNRVVICDKSGLGRGP